MSENEKVDNSTQDEKVSSAENDVVVSPSNQNGDEVSSPPKEEVLEMDETSFVEALNSFEKPQPVQKSEEVEAEAVEEEVKEAEVSEKKPEKKVEEDLTIDGEPVPVPDKNIPLHKLKANKDFLERQQKKLEEKIRKQLEEEYKGKVTEDKEPDKNLENQPKMTEDMESLIKKFGEEISEEGAAILKAFAERTTATESELKAKISELQKVADEVKSREEQEKEAFEAEEKAKEEEKIIKEVNNFKEKYPQAYTDKKWLNEYNPLLNKIVQEHNMSLNEAIKFAQATDKIPSDDILLGKQNVNKPAEKKEPELPKVNNNLIQNAKNRIANSGQIEEYNLSKTEPKVKELPQHFDPSVAIDYFYKQLEQEKRENSLNKVK
jgi:hypothetical protein